MFVRVVAQVAVQTASRWAGRTPGNVEVDQTGSNKVDIDCTFASTSEFSGQATRTKHSISGKLASLAGLSFPTLIVYAFL
jgi:hypothetical protein